jgi:hypothetical protein
MQYIASGAGHFEEYFSFWLCFAVRSIFLFQLLVIPHYFEGAHGSSPLWVTCGDIPVVDGESGAYALDHMIVVLLAFSPMIIDFLINFFLGCEPPMDARRVTFMS